MVAVALREIDFPCLLASGMLHSSTSDPGRRKEAFISLTTPVQRTSQAVVGEERNWKIMGGWDGWHVNC